MKTFNFGPFSAIFEQNEHKMIKNKLCSKTRFSSNFLKVRSIPDGIAAQNVWMVDSSRVKLSKPAVWTRNRLHWVFGHILSKIYHNLFSVFRFQNWGCGDVYEGYELILLDGRYNGAHFVDLITGAECPERCTAENCWGFVVSTANGFCPFYDSDPTENGYIVSEGTKVYVPCTGNLSFSWFFKCV